MPKLDVVIRYGSLEEGHDPLWLSAVDQGLKIIASHGYANPIDINDLDHAAASGNGGKSADFVCIAQGDLVGIGVVSVDVADVDANLDACRFEVLFRFGQALIVGFPTQKPAKQTHVRTLAFVGGGKGTIGVKLDEYILDVFIHQVATDSGYPQGGGTVRTGRPAHDGADDVVENAWVGAHWCWF